MKTRHYRDLEVWQRGMRLARSVYQATRSFPREEMFGLTSQLRRAAVSIPSNIAEGHGRLTDKVFLHFLSQARGSRYELENSNRALIGLEIFVGSRRRCDSCGMPGTGANAERINENSSGESCFVCGTRKVSDEHRHQPLFS